MGEPISIAIRQYVVRQQIELIKPLKSEKS